MGFTPPGPIYHGHQSGGIDPSVVTYIMNKEGLTPDQMSDLMNKKSGFLGMSGVSSDCRDLWAAAKEGNERAKLTLEIVSYQIKKIHWLLRGCHGRRGRGDFHWRYRRKR